MKESYELKKEGEFYITEVPSGSGVNFGFRKWTWGEKNALTSECSIVNPINGAISFNGTYFNEQLLIKTVFKKQDDKFEPFTTEELRTIDGQLGERLFQITQKINLVGNIDTQNL